MINLRFVLMVTALACLALAAADQRIPRVNLLALGLTLWLLGVLAA